MLRSHSEASVSSTESSEHQSVARVGVHDRSWSQNFLTRRRSISPTPVSAYRQVRKVLSTAARSRKSLARSGHALMSALGRDRFGASAAIIFGVWQDGHCHRFDCTIRPGSVVRVYWIVGFSGVSARRRSAPTAPMAASSPDPG